MPSAGQHAIVVGAGMSGLVAARVLADHFDRVTILERDSLPVSPASRHGTPQSNHPHGLLGGGLSALCTLFPGFDKDLAEAGAVPLTGYDVREELPGFDPFPRCDFGLTVYSMSRPLIEHVVRRRVASLPTITICERHRALELVANDRAAVVAVRHEDADGTPETLSADLVVDASARGALTLALLKACGLPGPTQTTIGTDISYATAIFAIPESKRDWKLALTVADVSVGGKSGYVMPIEGNRWMALISERHGDSSPPTDESGFREWARQLRTDTISRALEGAMPVDRIHRFGWPESAWLHYDRLADFPRGLIPIGDALCRFNPVYGQGMTVAAQEACLLQDLLSARKGLRDAMAGLGQAFLAAVQPLITAAWSQSSVPDLAHPLTRGDRPADLEKSLKYTAALMRVAARDREIHRMLIEVRHLLKPPSVLFEPPVARCVQAEMVEA